MLSKCVFYIPEKNHHFLWNVYSIKIHPIEFQLTNIITQIFCLRMRKNKLCLPNDRQNGEEAKKDAE